MWTAMWMHHHAPLTSGDNTARTIGTIQSPWDGRQHTESHGFPAALANMATRTIKIAIQGRPASTASGYTTAVTAPRGRAPPVAISNSSCAIVSFYTINNSSCATSVEA